MARSKITRVGLRTRWRALNLAQQFAIASFAVLLASMVVGGWWVSREIEARVTQISGATTALYVSSFVAPEVQELVDHEQLSENAIAVLQHLLRETPLGKRILSIKIWGHGGRVVYSNRPENIGRVFPETAELLESWEGRVSSDLSALSDEEDLVESKIGEPLLEIYTPVFQAGSRKVIAVVEFYELARDLQTQLAHARMNGWMIVALVTAAVFVALFGIVLTGSRTIVRQQMELESRIRQLSGLLSRNEVLHKRVQDASNRAAEFNEKLLRRISSELHDGPAQGIGFALLRLDALKEQFAHKLGNKMSDVPDLDRIRSSLGESLQEIRYLCSGMALPELDTLSLEQSIRRVVRAHERRYDTQVEVNLQDLPNRAEPSLKIAIYRFVQEALTNAYRHGGGKGQRVAVVANESTIDVEVSDEGCGFDAAAAKPGDDHLGIVGMRKRVELFGGSFSIESRFGFGTRVQGSFPLRELENV